MGQLRLILDLKQAHTVPQPSVLGPQSHLTEVLKKPYQLRAILEPGMAFYSFVNKGLVTCGVMGSVLRVGTQGSMPGPWRGLGASSAIVLEATGGILLAEWEAEKHCEMEPSSPTHTPLGFSCQDSDAGPSWLPARGSHPGVFRLSLREIHVLPITKLPPGRPRDAPWPQSALGRVGGAVVPTEWGNQPPPHPPTACSETLLWCGPVPSSQALSHFHTHRCLLLTFHNISHSDLVRLPQGYRLGLR